jgi:sarcosine oxidase, subunit alpha
MSSVNADLPIRLSPLQARHEELGADFVVEAGWRLPQQYQNVAGETQAVGERVGLADVSFYGKLLLKGEGVAALISRSLRIDGSNLTISATADQTVRRLRLLPDEYWLLTAPGGEDEARRCLETSTPEGVTIIDQTHGLAGLLVAGPYARDVVAKLCALSFDPLDFPNGLATQSSLAKVHAVILRRDLGNLAAFEIFVERPSADYVWQTILDAGIEFDIRPFGHLAQAALWAH